MRASEWVDWLNNRRLIESIGFVPSAEYEQAHYRLNEAQVLPNSEGDVIALTPENGRTVAEADVDQAVFIPPIVANDQIYLVTDEARLVVLR